MLGLEGFAAPLIRGLILTAAAILWTVLLVRIVGLRGFSKMTAFDFVTTIAAGSLIAQAGTRSAWSAFLQAMAAIAGIFLVQWLLAKARQKSDRIQQLISNEPVLLMENGQFLDRAMEETRASLQHPGEDQAGEHRQPGARPCGGARNHRQHLRPVR
jgi:uncharacterized membrane protein YcaP (DUF421 family)